MINVLATQYTLATKSLEIYLSGCAANPHCVGCHNPESWDFNVGDVYDKEYLEKKIINKVREFDNLIENIMIFGGEPLDQNHLELKKILEDMRQIKLPIWLFTRYSIEDIPNFVKENCEYIKCGEYDRNLISDFNYQYGIKLATSNQYIYKKGIDY